jgi:hypothetical protein
LATASRPVLLWASRFAAFIIAKSSFSFGSGRRRSVHVDHVADVPERREPLQRLRVEAAPLGRRAAFLLRELFQPETEALGAGRETAVDVLRLARVLREVVELGLRSVDVLVGAAADRAQVLPAEVVAREVGLR